MTATVPRNPLMVKTFARDGAPVESAARALV